MPRAQVAVSKECDELKSLPASGQSDVKLKSAVAQWATREGKTIHFANRMDLFHLKNAERARHLQTYKGCAMPWEGTLSRTNADAEPYSLSNVCSASQMARATVLDTISNFSDTVSASLLSR